MQLGKLDVSQQCPRDSCKTEQQPPYRHQGVMAGLQNHRRRLLITRLLSAQGPEDTNYEPEAGGNVTGLSVRSADSGPVSAG